MNQEQVDELMKKSKEELVAMIINLDTKLFDLLRELSRSDEYKGLVVDKNLNDFFVEKYEEER